MLFDERNLQLTSILNSSRKSCFPHSVSNGRKDGRKEGQIDDKTDIERHKERKILSKFKGLGRGGGQLLYLYYSVHNEAKAGLNLFSWKSAG